MATRVDESSDLLLEREAELEALAAALDSVSAGVGRLVAVEGTAGIGKTRLLAEVRARAARDGLRVLAARGGEFESGFAYGIVRQLFEPLVATASPEARAALLAGPASLVEQLFDPAALREGPAADSTFAVQHGLYWLAANAAYDCPTLIAVDDLHWADSASLRWLTYLARRLDGLPLLVLAATRPPEQGHDPALLVELLGDPGAATLEPGPLGVASIERLARDSFGLDPDEPFCAAVAVATGGNPLYASAVLDTVVRDGVEPRAESAREVLSLGPRAISRAVSVRLGGLPPEAVELARAAAILGDGTALRHAAALLQTSPETAARAAGDLVRIDVLRRPEPLEFFHCVVRTAIHEQIDPGVRMALHRRAAAMLAAEGAPAEQVAGHLVQVAPAADAAVAEALRRGATAAHASGADEAAVGYLRRALEEPPPESERFAILFELGLAERRLARPEAVELLAAAVESAPDAERRVPALLEYARALFYANRPGDAVELLRGSVDGLDDADPDLREQVEAELVASSMWLIDYRPLSKERLGRISIEKLHGGVGTAQLLASLAVDEAARGRSRELAIELAQRALAMPGIAHEGTVGFYYALNALLHAGETEVAYAAYSGAVERARRAGDLFTLSAALGFLGNLKLRHGELLDAESDLREGLELIRPAGNLTSLYHWYAGTLGEVLLERGETGEAAEVIASAELERQRPDNMQLAYLVAGRGKLRLAERDFEGALADFRSLGVISDTNPGWVPWRSLAGLALRDLGEEAEAREVVAVELEQARSWGSPVPIGVALRVLGLAEGGERGVALLEESVETLGPTPARVEQARSLVELGAALRRANRRADARVHLQDGLELAHLCGATVLETQARDELAATGARPRLVVQTGVETLTASERRVAQMAAQDLSNKEIAQTLFVTVKTVELHLSNVYRKLRIGSRRELGAALQA